MQDNELKLQQQIAFDLIQNFKHENTLNKVHSFSEGQQQSIQCAWVMTEGSLYYCVGLYSPKEPWGAVTQLIQGVFENLIDQSFFILRKKIYTTESATEFSQGMLKIAAKRAIFLIKPQNHQLKFEQKKIQILVNEKLLLHSKHLENRDFSSLIKEYNNTPQLHKLLELFQTSLESPLIELKRHQQNRKIAAAILDHENKIQAFSLAQNYKNKTLHAEVMCISQLVNLGYNLAPYNWTLISTLKPCKMCSGLIYEYFNQNQNIYYLNEDIGPMARHTILDQFKRIKKLTIS